MNQNLNVIGLISGGKDSFFSLLHCQANGHRIIAIANLYPPPPTNNEDSDLNSFMYQTVGHTLIPLYAEILALPLYRQEIRGTAVNRAKEYSTYHNDDETGSSSTFLDVDDETESMMKLLQRIKADYPEANAVCSGAILSSYQRTRIESVALRMNLVPLAYLWQYPELPTPVPREEGLLEDMAAVGMDARIVKVASGGLDEDLLWENVCAEATRGKIAKAMKRFGGSVMGEGGEFETLVVDGPVDFFEGAIEVGVEQRKIVRGGGGEASLNFMGGTSVQRKRRRADDRGWLEKLRIPNRLDEAFDGLLETLDHERNHTPALGLRSSVEKPSPMQCDWGDKYHICTGRWTTHISNLSASHVKDSTAAQMEDITGVLRSLLEHEVHRSTADIIFTTILLRSMDDFKAVNQKYAELFGTRPNPPARVTVACENTLPPGVNVMVSVVVALGPDVARQHLHVQSISYWAPANIGPYSQATSVRLGTVDNAPAVVYVAGQIPLVPESMEIVTRMRPSEEPQSEQDAASFRLQTTLALQHLWRIGKAMDVSWWVGAIAFIVAGEDDIRDKASIAALVWRKIHVPERHGEPTGRSTPTDDTGFDVWNERCMDGRSLMTGHENKVLPDFSCLSIVPDDGAEISNGYSVVPPLFTIEVAQLPRSSQIEWQGLGVFRAAVKFFETVWDGGNSITSCSMVNDTNIFGSIGIRTSSTEDDMYNQIESTISLLLKRCNASRTAHGHRTIYTSHELDMKRFRAQMIPCRNVWDVHGKELSAAIVVEYASEVDR
ncbi:MAG: hypothetical protein L6R38_000557 [Xanthoria sp. 2 TBL-2021]|nr:MAG: hypothetical protein L6R38_000557 [Xanthoria sp. 2 TBL-2021]